MGHEQYPGLRLRLADSTAAIWKARMHCPAFDKGKSGGLRCIYERFAMDEDECAVVLTVYLHQDNVKEADVIKRVKERFATYEPTAEGMRSLERSDMN